MTKREEQTKSQSLTEVVVSRFTVLVVATFTAELFVYDLFGVNVSTGQNVGMMIYWSLQSILIGYMLRRYFERKVALDDDNQNGDIYSI